MTIQIQAHPIADKMPLMPEEEFIKLKEDIKANGLQEPIILHEGKVLDGRHRARAVVELGWDIRDFTEEFANDQNPIIYAMSKNVRRRHLSIPQRAAVGASLLKLLQESSAQNGESGTKKINLEKAAATVGVHSRRITEIEEIASRDPETLKQVEAGHISIHKGRQKATANAIAPMLKKATARMKQMVGPEFVEQVQTGGIKFSPIEQIEFSSLSPSDMRQAAILMESGVKWKEAQQYKGMEITPETRLKQLHNLCLLHGGTLEDVSNGFKTVITKIIPD